MYETTEQLPNYLGHSDVYNTSITDLDEPSLLEELEIYPDRILKKYLRF